MSNTKANLDSLLGSRKEIVDSLSEISEENLEILINDLLSHPPETFFKPDDTHLSPYAVIKEISQKSLLPSQFDKIILCLLNYPQINRHTLNLIVNNLNFKIGHWDVVIKSIKKNYGNEMFVIEVPLLKKMHQEYLHGFQELMMFFLLNLPKTRDVYDLVEKSNIFYILHGHNLLDSKIQEEFPIVFEKHLSKLPVDELAEIIKPDSSLYNYYDYLIVEQRIHKGFPDLFTVAKKIISQKSNSSI